MLGCDGNRKEQNFSQCLTENRCPILLEDMVFYWQLNQYIYALDVFFKLLWAVKEHLAKQVFYYPSSIHFNTRSNLACKNKLQCESLLSGSLHIWNRCDEKNMGHALWMLFRTQMQLPMGLLCRSVSQDHKKINVNITALICEHTHCCIVCNCYSLRAWINFAIFH